MATDQTKVSRCEFYQAMGIVWTFIAIVLGYQLRMSTGYDVVVLFLAALFTCFVYYFLLLKMWFKQPNASAA